VDQTPRAKAAFFLTFNVEAELRTRCRDGKFWDAIHHPIDRVKG